MQQIQGRRFVSRPQGRPVVEEQAQPLYSQKQLAATTSQTVTFFKSLGASDTILTTNMASDGLLPYPHGFHVYGISMWVQDGTAEADWRELLNNGVLTLELSQKPYLQIPIHKIPSGIALGGLVDTTQTNDLIYQVQNSPDRPFFPVHVSGRPISLLPQQDFKVVVQTFNTTAFSATIDMWLYLEGVRTRPVL